MKNVQVPRRMSATLPVRLPAGGAEHMSSGVEVVPVRVSGIVPLVGASGEADAWM